MPAPRCPAIVPPRKALPGNRHHGQPVARPRKIDCRVKPIDSNRGSMSARDCQNVSPHVALSWSANKKTPPLAAKRNGGAGTEKRPTPLMIPIFTLLSIVSPRNIGPRAVLPPGNQPDLGGSLPSFHEHFAISGTVQPACPSCTTAPRRSGSHDRLAPVAVRNAAAERVTVTRQLCDTCPPALR